MPEEVNVAKPTYEQYVQMIVRYLGPQWPVLAALMALLLGDTALRLYGPQIMRQFIDTARSPALAAGDKGPTLLRMGLLFVGVVVAQQVVSVLATYTSEDVGWTSTNALRSDLARHCLSLDMSFHNAHTPGEMIERVDGDVSGLSNLLSQFVLRILANVLLLLGVLALLFWEDWRVGLTLGAFVLLAAAILGRTRGIAVPHFAAERQSSAELFGFLEERLAGTEDIRACGAKAYVMRRFYQLARQWMHHSLRAGLMVNIMINAISTLVLLGPVVALAVGGYLYLKGQMTIGAVYVIFQYGSMLAIPVNEITQQMQDLQRAGASVARVRDLLNTSSRIADPERARAALVRPSDLGPSGKALRLEFRDVSFGYGALSRAGNAEPPEGGQVQDGQAGSTTARELVLHDVSFDLPAGEALGLLGRTGSGKTTLMRLLFRFYDPDSGTIRIGSGLVGSAMWGIADLPLGELRRRVGMVTQEIQLFHATVRENLTFFDPASHDEHILPVIRELGLGKWYDALPHGLDTVLESGGGGLSAGEAQLLAFVRIFLQDPGLVILDEASARLDPATEEMLEDAVGRLVRDRTAIIIAHRLSTVQRTDRIMILEEGRIGEYGVRGVLAADPSSRFSALLRTGLKEVLV